MRRLLTSGVLGIIVLLVTGCTGQKVHLSPEAGNYAEYQTVYIKPNSDDPLQLSALIREKLEDSGYRVSGESTGNSGGSLILSYDYATAPDISENGKVSRRLKWFRVRLADSTGQHEVASGKVSSGFLKESPEDKVGDLITAVVERLQSRPESMERAEVNNEEPEKPILESKKKKANNSTQPESGVNTEEKDSLSHEEENSGNPWIPRFKSWGFEEWGEED